MIVGTGHCSDTDRIAPKNVGCNLGRIIAGTENNHVGAWDPA
jgi:hypothetical protein